MIEIKSFHTMCGEWVNTISLLVYCRNQLFHLLDVELIDGNRVWGTRMCSSGEFVNLSSFNTNTVGSDGLRPMKQMLSDRLLLVLSNPNLFTCHLRINCFILLWCDCDIIDWCELIFLIWFFCVSALAIVIKMYRSAWIKLEHKLKIGHN